MANRVPKPRTIKRSVPLSGAEIPEGSGMELRERVMAEARASDYDCSPTVTVADVPDTPDERGPPTDDVPADPTPIEDDYEEETIFPLTEEQSARIAEAFSDGFGLPVAKEVRKEDIIEAMLPVIKQPRTRNSYPTMVKYDTGRSVIRVYALIDIPTVYIEECFRIYLSIRPRGTDEDFLCILQEAVHRHSPSRLFRYVTFLDTKEMRQRDER